VPANLSHLAGAVIVFDLDGTLVDTAPDLTATLNVLLAREGVAPLAIETARRLIGRGARVLIERGFEAAGVPLADAALSVLFERFIDHYRAHIADQSRPFPGAVAALDDLRAAGARLAVCTNKPTDLSVALFKALGLDGYFAAVVGPDAAGARKPDPRHLIAAIERAGGRRRHSVMVGDSASDADAARAAGVPLVLVSFGYSEVAARALCPDVLIDAFDELPAACASLLAPCPAGALPL
jgi:phosphoglycolate phosphatase